MKKFFDIVGLILKSALLSARLLAFACAALAGSVGPAGELPARFDVGDCRVNLFPSRANVAPTVTFADRTFTFAYRTDGWLLDGERRVGWHSAQTNALAVLKETPKGVRADYVHSLYAGEGTARRLVGLCSNEVVFAKGVVGVRATLYPSEPGRYRFYWSQKAAHVIVFSDYVRRWVGTTLWMTVSDELSHSNELQPHDRFDLKAWGLNGNQIGPAREMTFGNVPDIITFKGTGNTRFASNRYPGGFEASAFCLNDDVMHKPAWDGPVRFSYFIHLEK